MSNISDDFTKFDCTVWPYVGRDQYGNPNFGAPVYMINAVWYMATSMLFRDSNGKELTAKYKIMPKFEFQDNFKSMYYVAFGDHQAEPDPINVDSHEIKSARLIKVPFGGGLEDEMVVMV